jgi:membrane dipeptidase
MSLHSDAIVIDGLNVSEWTPDLFDDLLAAGVTAANCTCCIWEGFDATMREVAAWKRRFAEHADRIVQVYDVEDIRAAKASGRVGVILGWQNSSGFDDYLPFVSLFAELGLRVVQLTYNTANAVGSGCYETRDTGLTDYGRDLIAELNATGILIDLSHVAARTAADAIAASSAPVAYTHTLPAAHRAHPRNKSDDELRLLAEHGGFVGLTFFPAFLRNGPDSTVDDYLDAAEHVIDLVGKDRVGIGTDFTQGRDAAFFDFISRDRGYGRRLVDLGTVGLPRGLSSVADLPLITQALEERGWDEALIRGFIGENWLTFLGEVWDSPGSHPVIVRAGLQQRS